MRCRADQLIFALAAVVATLSLAVIVITAIIPLDMGGWLLSLAAFWWGLPFALLLALCAAVTYFVEQKMSGKPPGGKE